MRLNEDDIRAIVARAEELQRTTLASHADVEALVRSGEELGMRGGEVTVRSDEMRACSFLAGERVTCPRPGWGAWNCTVLSYDARNACVTVTDGWAETQTFPIRDVWLSPPVPERLRRRRIYAALLTAGAATGAAAGALVTSLVL